MKVAIIGTGYVGLVTGVCLAEKGHDVTCVDIDKVKVDAINKGVVPIHEEGLQEILLRNLGKRFRASQDLDKAVQESCLSLIAVGTPFDGRTIDLSFVKNVSLQIGRALLHHSGYHVVVVKSTVVPGTTEEVVLPILEAASGKKAGSDFGVCMNPEFLTEGQAVQDFMFPDRLVAGGLDEKSLSVMSELYGVFTDVPKIWTTPRTAEMIKYVSNCLLATMISFSNEIANLCSTLDIDVVDVMSGVHQSNYFSWARPEGGRELAGITSFLSAGCGYGGSCLPKDVRAFIAHGRKKGIEMNLLAAVDDINVKQPEEIVKRLRSHFPELRGVSVGVLGLSFRPNTSDMRESPAIPLIRMMAAEGAVLKAYDPVSQSEATKVFSAGEVELCDRLEDAISGVSAVVLVTRWEEFRRTPALMRQLNPKAVFIDGRRMLNKADFSIYEGIGL